MMTKTEKVIRHIFKLFGGREKAFQVFNHEYRQLTARWDQDTVKIGRVLRSHLFVEHFMTEYLTAMNPELGPIEEARLSFSQKLALIDTDTVGVSYLLPGIRRINTIRNRIAHTLTSDISNDDVNVFLGITLFRTMREEGAKPKRPSADPIDILENFAKHAGIALQARSTQSSQIWAKAIRLAESDEIEDETEKAT